YYKGEITITQNVYDKSRLRVDYNYRTSFLSEVDPFQAIGQETYKSSIDFELPKTPVKYKGIYQVTLTGGDFGTEFILDEGQDYSISYNEDGDNIELKFLIGSPSELTSYPHSDSAKGPVYIRIKYYYTPDIAPDTGNVSQKLAGITAHTNINENWSISTEFAAAMHNFSKPREQATANIIGTGKDNEAYSIKPNLVENSEYVYINNELQNKDSDYWINYDRGTIKFLFALPSTADTKVLYEYYVTGETQAGVQKEAFAYKLASKYKLNNIIFLGDFKHINKGRLFRKGILLQNLSGMHLAVV
ncbi:hypothetical protein ACFL2K_05360, partial [Candidatus Margulisiibacteriota bacterium]